MFTIERQQVAGAVNTPDASGEWTASRCQQRVDSPLAVTAGPDHSQTRLLPGIQQRNRPHRRGYVLIPGKIPHVYQLQLARRARTMNRRVLEQELCQSVRN